MRNLIAVSVQFLRLPLYLSMHGDGNARVRLWQLTRKLFKNSVSAHVSIVFWTTLDLSDSKLFQETPSLLRVILSFFKV